jgi:chemotaxis protein MotB
MAKKQEKKEGAPEWMVTYGDAMTLLLCFFVIIVSMSEIKQDEKFMKVLESLRVAFGGYQGNVGAIPVESVPTNTIIRRLIELDMPINRNDRGDVEDKAIEGKQWRVTNVRDGVKVVVGGQITFDRFSATLKPEAKRLIAQAGEILGGYNMKILIRGHATRELLPADSIYANARDLSYARAQAVADELVRTGVDERRLLIVACGDTEPLKDQAYTEERRQANRRVDIVVTEDLISDYDGSTIADDEEETSYGG